MQLIDDFVTTKHNIELLKMKLQKEKSKAAGALGGVSPPTAPVMPDTTVSTGTAAVSGTGIASSTGIASTTGLY